MKTLQDIITEKFEAGEGDQQLPLTVQANNHTNLEVKIGDGLYTVSGDSIARIHGEAAPVSTGIVGSPINIDTAAESGDDAEQAREQVTADGGTDTGATAEAPAAEGDVDAEGRSAVSGGEIPTGENSSYNTDTQTFSDAPPDDQQLIDAKFKEVMEFFGADDLEHMGEAINSGEDIFALKKGGEIIEQGTLRELEDRMMHKLHNAEDNQA